MIAGPHTYNNKPVWHRKEEKRCLYTLGGGGETMRHRWDQSHGWENLTGRRGQGQKPEQNSNFTLTGPDTDKFKKILRRHQNEL